MSTRGTKIAHIPALDGLRAVAVLAVIAYHYGLLGFTGGFLGVDLFFVLSGFLITSLLLTEHAETGAIALGAFWSRRFRRLMPASLLVLVTVAAWGWSQVSPYQLGRLRGDILATLGYGANWRFVASGQSYFDLSAEPSPLRHAWSLAIEEQFYVVWPLLVAGLLWVGRGRRWLLATVSAAAAVISALVMAVVYDPADPSRAYYGTDTRAAQLLAGALLAMAWTHRVRRLAVEPRTVTRGSRWPREVLGWSAVTAMVSAFVLTTDDDGFLYHGGFVAFSAVSVAVVWAVVSGPSSLAKVLSWRPLTSLGAISYGLYLWHWPVSIALSEKRTVLSGWTLTGAQLALTLVLAVLSYVLVETPIRRRRGWGDLGGWRSAMAMACAVPLVIGLSVSATADAESSPEYLQGEVGDIVVTNNATDVVSDPTKRMVLIGDSLARSVTKSLSEEARRRGWSFAAFARPGCSVMPQAAADHPCTVNFEEFMHHVTAAKPSTIIWMSDWDQVDNLYVEHPAPRLPVGETIDFLGLLDTTVARLTGSGARVDFVLSPNRSEPGADVTMNGLYARTRHAYVAYHRFRPGLTNVLDLASAVCPDDGVCPSSHDGVVLRPVDGIHYGPEGAAWVAAWIFDQLEASASSATIQSSSQPR